MRTSKGDSWKDLFLRSTAPPAWLSVDAPQSDVVLSSRYRVMRNLIGHRFPTAASAEELRLIRKQVALAASNTSLEDIGSLTPPARDYLVGCRLISPDFDPSQPGRGVYLDAPRSLSLMVNEEDHLRLQSLTAGYSFENCTNQGDRVLAALGQQLSFAHHPRFGFLAASPFNAGEGRRLSTMLHLIGLAHSERLPAIIRAAAARGITARGLFGEASRAVGAYVQISVTQGSRAEFVGAVDYLIRAEREARQEISRTVLADRAKTAIDFAISSPTLSLAHSLRVLGWIRWAAGAEIPGLSFTARDVDSWLTVLEIRDTSDEDKSARHRADFLRTRLDP